MTTRHRRYLEEGSSFGELHNAFIFWMIENYPEEDKMIPRFYHTIFTWHYNIVFKPPKTDVCSTCERFEVMIKNVRGEGQDVTGVDLGRQKEETQVPRRLLQDAEAAPIAADDDNLHVVAMDLQQTLPCPRLRAGVAFYKRKLWVYNFCVYDISKQEATMFV